MPESHNSNSAEILKAKSAKRPLLFVVQLYMHLTRALPDSHNSHSAEILKAKSTKRPLLFVVQLYMHLTHAWPRWSRRSLCIKPSNNQTCTHIRHMRRVGQNRVYTSYNTVYMGHIPAKFTIHTPYIWFWPSLRKRLRRKASQVLFINIGITDVVHQHRHHRCCSST